MVIVAPTRVRETSWKLVTAPRFDFDRPSSHPAARPGRRRGALDGSRPDSVGRRCAPSAALSPSRLSVSRSARGRSCRRAWAWESRCRRAPVGRCLAPAGRLGCSWIIIDEVIALSPWVLGLLEFYLRRACRRHPYARRADGSWRPFDGINLVFAGDLWRPPVCDRALFANLFKGVHET